MPRRSTGRSSPGSPGSGSADRPFFAFLNYNDAHSPLRGPRSIDPGLRAAARLLRRPPDLEELGHARQDEAVIRIMCRWQ